MDIQVISVGRVANDGTGDDLRTANQKTNANVSILKSAVLDAQGTAASALAAVGEIVVSGFSKRVAAEAIPDDTYVVDQPGNTCLIANPLNPDHQGLVLGLVVNGVAEGEIAVAQREGSISDVSGTFSGGDKLYIGDGTTGRRGSIVNAPPAGRTDQGIWRQQVGTATTVALINAALGQAYRVPALGSTAITGGPTGYATTTAFSRAALGLLGRKAVADADYVISQMFSYVGITALTAGRTVTLPPASAYIPGQTLFIADESGACSPTLPITIAATGSDTIAGQAAIAMGSAYQKFAFHSNGSNLWTVA